jgi:predicted dehydrogenase
MPRVHQPDRRDFLKTSAAVGVGYWTFASARMAHSRSANEEIRFASIGVGGKGDSDSEDAARHGALVAICDIDEGRLENKAKRHPQARKFTDFRKMLEELDKSIDAVTVSTPDHTHAVAAAMAMKLGKHCFVQKPLTHSIHEARTLGEIARAQKVATQMGNQGTADNGLRESAALVQSGALGTVTEVHVWTNRPGRFWKQGIPRPSDTPPVPPHVHWDLFLGPAAERPYHPVYHPFSWRGWWAFGTGALGDMGCHTLNMPFAALGLRNPTAVEAQTSGHNGESYPEWSIVTYEFPATDARGALKLVWYDGGKLPPEELLLGQKVESSGSLIIGSQARLYTPGDYGGGGRLLDNDGKPLSRPKVEIRRSPGHFREWVDAIRGGEPAMSNFPDYASPLTETVLLGNLAVWAGKRVQWDAQAMRATNAPELEPLIRHTYRKGWEL